jgi:hypothetical protein
MATAGLVIAPVFGLGSGTTDAGAVVAPVAGCGFHLGTISQSGAAGTLFFSVVLQPTSPAEHCTTSVRFTASVSPATTTPGPYTDIDDDPLTTSETVSFVPGRLAPQLGVGWGGFHCADPAVPGTFTFSSGAQVTSTGVTPSSCGPAGAPHSFLRAAPLTTDSEVAIVRTVDDHGYLTVNQTGSITAEGDAAPVVATAYSAAPVVGMASPPAGGGEWVVASDGGIFTYGNAVFYGSLGALTLNAPVVGMAATPDGKGYWLVAADGGVFAFGDAGFAGSLGALTLNAPVVGMAATPDGKGYWLVAADGGVFTFGDAAFHGSLGALTLNAPIAGLAATSTGAGYWLAGADNGIFAFGNAGFYGADPISS